MGFKDNSDCGKSYFRGNAENNMTWGSDSEIQWNSAAGNPSLGGVNPNEAQIKCDCDCEMTITFNNGTTEIKPICCGVKFRSCGGTSLISPNEIKSIFRTDSKGNKKSVSMRDYKNAYNKSIKGSAKAITQKKPNIRAIMQKFEGKSIKSLAKSINAEIIVNGEPPSTDYLSCDCSCLRSSILTTAGGEASGRVVCCDAPSITCGTFKITKWGGAMTQPTIVVTYNSSIKDLKGKGGEKAPIKKTRFNGFI